MARRVVDEIALLTRIATLYYLEDATQAEIAAQLGFSRPKVARLLKRARVEGIVDISIRAHPAVNMELESQLVERFPLKGVALVPQQSTETAQRSSVARAAAETLDRLIRARSVITVGMGRNLAAIPEQLRDVLPRPCTFVSAIGGSPQADAHTSSNDICRRLAEQFEGTFESLYAPAYAESEASREVFLGHPEVREVLASARRADVAIVGVGDARDDSAVVQMGCFSAREMARMRKAGAVGDILGHFFDVRGAPAKHGLANRVVGLTAVDLSKIPDVVAVTSETGKARALLGALRAQLIDFLVTTVGLAEETLTLAGRH